MTTKRLGIGFNGSGFITRFHIASFIAVRDADIRGIWSPNAGRAAEAAALGNARGVGEAKAFPSIEAMVKDPSIDAIWICGPNHERVANMKAILEALGNGGELQGGGVLNDMMCHSIEAARYLLTEPGKLRESLKAKKVSAQIACMKWQRPAYVEKLKAAYGSDVDYSTKPSEDFARAIVEYEDGNGEPLIVEATTSWSYVGAGLRLSMGLLGPEYSMKVNTLDTELSLFFSHDSGQSSGEDLVEKQNAELGLMPVVTDEGAYGYVDENRHMVQSFLKNLRPEETFDDGVAVTELLMTAYKSAEIDAAVELEGASLDEFVPAVARGV